MDRAIPSYFTPLIDPEQLDERYSNVAGRLFLDCRIQRRYCTSHLQTGIARLVRPGAKKISHCFPTSVLSDRYQFNLSEK